jgi:stage V sporulation protein B
MASLVIPLATGGIILAKPIINLFFGHQYLNSVVAFQLLLLMIAIVWIITGYSRILLASGNQIAYARVSTIIAIINLILNFLLIPYYGLIGAAIATVLAEGLGSIFWYRESRKIVQFPAAKIYFLPLLASVPMALLVYLESKMSFPVLIIIPTGMIIYSIVLYLFNGITTEEIISIIDILRGVIKYNK